MPPNGFDGLDEPIPPPQLTPPGLPDRLKKYLIPIVIVVCVILVWIWPWPPSLFCWDAKCHTIEAHKVVQGPDLKMKGSFTVKQSIFRAIVTDRRSGACLFLDHSIFKLDPIATPSGKCATDADCGGPILSKANFDGWESTCHKPSGTCWVRPGAGDKFVSEVCNKGLTATPGQVNDSNIPQFDPRTLDSKVLKPEAKGKMTKARIVACLNGVFVPPNAPCGLPASTNRIVRFSDTTDVMIP